MIKQPRDRPSLQRARSDLAARLRARFPEIEESITSRVMAISEPGPGQSLDYRDGLRAAVAEALAWGVGAIEHGQDWDAPVPIAATGQAKRAARSGVSLETVLRRYSAGDRELRVYVAEEAHGLPHMFRREIERTQGGPVDRLMEAVASEYGREVERMQRSPTSPLEERVRRLLEGDLTVDLLPDYDLRARHIAAVVDDPTAERTLRQMAKVLDARLLLARNIRPYSCAWLSRRGGLSVAEVERCYAELGASALFALGESRTGVEGWRLTHFEAQATFEAMRRGGTAVVRARDVLLSAAVLRDPVLTQAVLSSYTAPLDEDGADVGANLRETLRAYLATGHQASAAGELLGVNRRTVKSRIKTIESRLGQRLEDCHAEVKVALQVETLLRPRGSGDALGADAARAVVGAEDRHRPTGRRAMILGRGSDSRND